MQIFTFISDVLLVAATLGMALWCRILSQRLKAFNDIDTGLGGTIAALSLQVDDLKASIASAAASASAQGDDRARILSAATEKADDRIGRMEMLLASLEDLEEEASDRLLRDPVPPVGIEPMPSFRAARTVDFGRGGR
ncbi:MAG: hypothetical protein WBA02_07340 [Jannaschia helgolandensis]|uniref:Uncharacterized protein n=1 Tax=Jannaschia helgolandensis TaxID=188906 RepID=A0A1H7H1B5_9RHOB|nr:hypothetical protein [Jannaschia helgolandensis]SEK44104.1 hypothetical protein SAMN04488526_0581 [Jannaschia helgolandensis]